MTVRQPAPRQGANASHHAADLAAAADDDRSAFGFTWVPHEEAGARQYVRTQLDSAQNGELVPFAVEIGFTWLATSAQGSGINLEAKLLLLTHAFERLGVARVDFKTDARNEGRLRDCAMYSVLASDWPSCEDHLLKRLGRLGLAGHASVDPRAGRSSRR